ncbi:MAG TPA: serine/threonine-protein kinase [Polyangiaceae bacterium]|nr:serine/threonine-protein kinase [Polyangiaceae bacterium]
MPGLPTIAGFRVIEELGSGSVSSVYKAVEEPLGRTVALKVLKGTIGLDSPFAAQLEREAQMLATLSHANIGLLYAFSKTDAGMHLVLEYVDGFSLAQLAKKKPVLSPEAVAAIGAAVARGLSHAHERGIVHRDVKPANILVSRAGDVKLFDFGIAQRTSKVDEPAPPPSLAPLRLENIAAFGTPAYMAPEQILGEGVDARSDLFSLGVVLYQLLCGARPFERGDEADQRPAAHRIRRDPAIPLHRRAPEVPAVLERIVMRAIQKLPADRFHTAEAMAEQLEEVATARSGLRGTHVLVDSLAAAGLVTASDGASSAAPVRTKRASPRPAVAGLALLGAVVLASGAVLQSTAHREGDQAGARPLDLLPAAPGYLRVMATPWAEVWVDGQRVDVTPFARPIPLAAGTHYVTLVHPSAPIEKRTVSIAKGEVRTIDAVMNIPPSSASAGAGRAPPVDDAGAEEASSERDPMTETKR